MEFFGLSPLTVISALSVFVLGSLYLFLKDRPPGPRGLPYFGLLPYLKNETMHFQLKELTKEYGDVFCFTILGKLFVHLGTIKAVKEAHVTRADCFTQRNTDFNILSLTFDDGLLTVNGERWMVLRKFFIQGFRDYGLMQMKDYLTGPIYETVDETVIKLKCVEGKKTNIGSIFNIQVSTVMKRTLFNDSGITEEELSELIENYEKLIVLLVNVASIYQGRFARSVLFPRLPGYKMAIESKRNVADILRRIVKRHEETFDESGVRNIIDAYTKERNERQRKNDPTAEYFTESSLIYSLSQIVGDGISGVVVFINYLMYTLLEYPEEQEKIFQELEEVVGSNRGITLEDKNKLPYLNAFILETLRTSDFFNLFPSLECTKETTINGCRIPVGTITLMNVYASHRDPRVFEDPDTFKPSRYISQPGKPKTEYPISFGVGRRSCAGESFSMMMGFLFVATVVKSFRLIKPENFSRKYFFESGLEIIVQSRK